MKGLLREREKGFHNSVVMTVFSIGILDLSDFLLITLSCTSQGDISSMLPCFVLLLELREVFFLFLAECPLNEFLLPLLLITFDRLPLLRDSELFVLILFLFTAFLFAFELDLARLEARTGSRLDDCCKGFLPTLLSDRVTGWLFAKEVSILLRVDVLESLLSDVGSREASGELLGDPVDMGDGEAGAGAGTVGAAGASRRSRNGFLLLFGDENGFVRPIVANFWPELKGLFSV